MFSKLGIYILIGVAIVAVVGGFFAYQRITINDLNATIKTQQEQIAGLVIDKEKLTIANEIASRKLEQKQIEFSQIQSETDAIRNSELLSTKRINELEKKLEDTERLKKLEDIAKGRRATLFLRNTNRTIKCDIEAINDSKFGKCVDGKFIPNE